MKKGENTGKKSSGKSGARRSLQVKILVVLSVILVGSIALNVGIGMAGRKRNSSPDYQREIEKVITECTEGRNVPGVIVGVDIPGLGRWTTCKGVSDLETGQPITSADKVRIASITKTFSVTVLLQLVDEGRLSLDDTLERFVPWVQNAGGITLRQLCNHTSGIFNFGEDSGFGQASMGEPLRKWTDEELVRIATAHPPLNAPGEGYHYSSTNTVLVGMVIEKVTGSRVGDEITRRIIEPLGLINTIYAYGPVEPEGLIKGYVLLEQGSQNEVIELPPIDPSMGSASLAMISNMYDLRTWAKALATGTLLSPGTQNERLKFVDTENPGVHNGLGIIKKGDFLGHHGIALGFTSSMFYLPSKDATIVVIANVTSDPPFVSEEILKGIGRIFFPESVNW